jgi:hypothetical protein
MEQRPFYTLIKTFINEIETSLGRAAPLYITLSLTYLARRLIFEYLG